MQEQLAGEALWLGGGLLFAWLICALAQLAAFLPAFSRGGIARGKVRCAKRERERGANGRGPAFATGFALLLTIPPGLLAAFCARSGIATVAVVEVGVLAGLWLGSRRDLRPYRRAIAALAYAAGAAMLAGGFASFLSGHARVTECAALFLAVILGAALLGAAAAVRADTARQESRAPFASGDRAVHYVALLLCAGLGYGFVTAGAREEFGLSALVAAGVLGIALGVRLMSGARRPHVGRLARVAAIPPSGAGRQRSAYAEPPLRLSFAGVPDECLVEACASGSFAAGCLYHGHASTPEGADARALRHLGQDRPRRRRSRHRAPGQSLGQRKGPH